MSEEKDKKEEKKKDATFGEELRDIEAHHKKEMEEIISKLSELSEWGTRDSRLSEDVIEYMDFSKLDRQDIKAIKHLVEKLSNIEVIKQPLVDVEKLNQEYKRGEYMENKKGKKKEEKKEDPVEWGSRDERLGAIAIEDDISEKEKDSKRKR